MDIIAVAAVAAASLAGIVLTVPTAKYAFDIAPYLYANTRSAARSSTLLQKKDYDEIMSANSVDEAYAMLEDTPYSYIVEHSRSFPEFSKMLNDDLYKTYIWLERIVPNKLKPVIKALKIKFEVQDMKNLVNALRNGSSIPEMRFIQDIELKNKLESVKDYQSLAVIAEGTRYEHVFSQNSLDNLPKLNTELDKISIKAVYSLLIRLEDRQSSAAFLDYLRSMIDMINIRIVLKKLSSKSDCTDLIEGGTISADELSSINDKMQLESIFANSQYSEFITDYSPSSIENAFTHFTLRLSSSVNAKYTLKAGAIVKFVILKELEVRNLNALIKLKTDLFTQQEIEKFVVV